MKTLKNKKQEKPTCITCIQWNRIKTGTPIIIEKSDTPEEILSKIPKGKTAELTNETNIMQIVEFYCKIGHKENSNCKDYKENLNNYSENGNNK